MYTIYGAHWCGGCKTIRKLLAERDVPYSYIEIPTGTAGYDLLEEVSGRRAAPYIVGFPNANAAASHIKGLGLPTRPLTQDELDEINYG